MNKRLLNVRFRKSKKKIRTAEIISADDMADNVASLGKLVTVRESDTGNVVTYEIVGVMSTDPFAFKISKRVSNWHGFARSRRRYYSSCGDTCSS